MAKKAARKKKKELGVIRYFRETWIELKKVSWPTRQEAINLTLIVLAVTVFMAALLGVLDYLFAQAFAFFLR